MSSAARLFTLSLFCLGAAARAVFVFYAHPAANFVYSDMHGYVDHAQRILVPGRETIFDTFHPPGLALLLAFLHRWDPTWHAAYVVQWALCTAVLVLIWDVARRLFDVQVAAIALAIAAFYYPLLHYAGFFLAENSFTFFALLCFDAFVMAWQAPSVGALLGASTLCGTSLGVATAFKNSMLGPAAVLALGAVCLALKQRRGSIWVLTAVVTLSAATVLWPLAQRCTRLQGGTFCLAAANSGANILIGHYGDAAMFYWHDAQRGIDMNIGSPDSFMRGYTRDVRLDFGGYDDARNLALARSWIMANKREALLLSLRNVADLFTMHTLWPSAVAFGIDWGAVSQWFFGAVIALPALLYLLWRARPRDGPRQNSEAEWLLTLPLLGLMATVFISVSEVRYRVPFDPLLIILAARGIGSLTFRKQSAEKPCTS